MIDLISPFLIYSAIQAATPLLLAAMAGVFCSRVGVFNMALEGQMLVGAFVAVAAGYFTHNAYAGIAAAMVGTMVFSVILAAGSTWFRGNPVVLCIGMNLLASGMTAYFLRLVFGVSGTFTNPAIPLIPRLSLPGLAELGPWGAVLNNQTAVTYVSWLVVVLCAILLFRTPIGLRIRGAGENPEAAVALGVDVDKLQFATVVVSGALVGLGGAQLSLGAVTLFSEDMTAGRGWIALVAIMLARDNPVGAALACLLFGLTDALGLRLQSFGLPNQIATILPYVITLVALVAFAKRKRQLA